MATLEFSPHCPIKTPMDNRRNSYRVRLEEDERIPAELLLIDGRKLTGKIVSISLGGIGLVTDTLDHGLSLHQHIQLRYALPGVAKILSYFMEIRRVGSGSDANAIGLKVIPYTDEHDNAEREKQIWPFILARQNREIRKVKSSRRPSS